MASKPDLLYNDVGEVGDVASFFGTRRKTSHGIQATDGLYLDPESRDVQYRSIDIGGEREAHFLSFWNGKFQEAMHVPFFPVPLEYYRAEDYWEEVDKLDRSPAGKVAIDLLKEFLSPIQQEDLDKQGSFKELRPTRLAGGRTAILEWRFGVRPFEVWLAKSNGKAVAWSFCWHPEEPLPSGDLVLVHLLEIRNSPQNYIKQANF